MTANRTPGDQVAVLVRPVDASERLFYRFSERNPAHHVMVAEFAEVLTADRVRSSLAAVQRRHPLLSVHVEDRPDTRLGFYRASTVAPIALTVHRSADPSWQEAGADELSRPFDRSHAPLVRASLLQGRTRSALLLTFDHTIADGISAILVLRDVIDALNGEALPDLPVQPSQERVIARELAAAEPFDVAELPHDTRMLAPSTFRPFDGALTNVHTMVMTDAETARLVQRCRAERTTVHAAVVVAMCRVRAAERGEDFVRVLNPINCRALIGVQGDCGLFIQSTVTGLAPRDGMPFWEQARETTAHLEVARSTRGIRTASLLAEQVVTVDADVSIAEEVYGRMSPWELLVTNLGVQNFDGTGPLRPTAVWGPVVQSQTDGEYVTGINTYEGRLRMVTCGYSVPITFLKDVGETLAAAVHEA